MIKSVFQAFVKFSATLIEPVSSSWLEQVENPTNQHLRLGSLASFLFKTTPEILLFNTYKSYIQK